MPDDDRVVEVGAWSLGYYQYHAVPGNIDGESIRRSQNPKLGEYAHQHV